MRTLLATALAATLLAAIPEKTVHATPLAQGLRPGVATTSSMVEQAHYYRHYRRHHSYRTYNYYPYSYGYVNPGFSFYIGPRYHRHRHWRW